MRSPWIPLAVMALLLIAFRVVGALFPYQLPNFQPLPAFLLCSLIAFRGTKSWLLPLGVCAAWLLSNPIVSWLQGGQAFGQPGPVITAFLAIVACGLLALPLRGKASSWALLGAGLAAAVLFHAITSLTAWIFDPRYAKTLTGLVQATWTGLPGDVLPTWAFFRNLAAANLLFTGFFLAARQSVSAPLARPAAALR